MAINFSDYGNGDLIPADTIAPVQIRITYGDGTDGVLTPTKAKDAEALKAELTVLEGEYAKRKLFAFWIVTGTTDGQKSMTEHYNKMLKRVIASAKFLDPNDRSPETLAKYVVDWRDFDGLRFLAEIGIEPGKDGLRGQKRRRAGHHSRLATVGRPSADRTDPADRQRRPHRRGRGRRIGAGDADREAAVGVVRCARIASLRSRPIAIAGRSRRSTPASSRART